MTLSNPSRNALLIAILALTAVAYVQSFSHLFVLDDHDFFARVIPALHSPLDPWKTGNAFQSYYRPVFVTSLYIDSILFGDSAAGYHVVNLLLHLLVVFLAFRFAERLFRDARWAAAVAVLFAIHPTHTENVSWVSGRTDLLCGVFVFLTLLSFLTMLEKRSSLSMWLSALFFFLALGSKEVAIVLPLLCIALAYAWRFQQATNPAAANVPTREGKAARRRREKEEAAKPLIGPVVRVFVLFAAGIGAFLLLRQAVSKEILTDNVFTTFEDRAFNTIRCFAMYIWHAVFGRGYEYIVLGWRCQEPEFNLQLPAEPEIWVLIGLTCAAFIAALVVAVRAKRALMMFGLIGFALTILPALGIVPIMSIFSVRFLYLPSFFFLMAVVDGARWLLARPERAPMIRFAAGAVAVLSIWWGVETFRQDTNWHDDVTLMESMKADATNSPVWYFSLGNGYRYRNQFMEAANKFSNALLLYNDYHDAHLNLAACYVVLGQTHPEYYESAIKAYSWAAERFPQDGHIYMLRGDVYTLQGKGDLASQDYSLAWALTKSPETRERMRRMGVAPQ